MIDFIGGDTLFGGGGNMVLGGLFSSENFVATTGSISIFDTTSLCITFSGSLGGTSLTGEVFLLQGVAL